MTSIRHYWVFHFCFFLDICDLLFRVILFDNYSHILITNVLLSTYLLYENNMIQTSTVTIS